MYAIFQTAPRRLVERSIGEDRATGEETRKHQEAKEERWGGVATRERLWYSSDITNPFSPHRGQAACRGWCSSTSIDRPFALLHLSGEELRVQSPLLFGLLEGLIVIDRLGLPSRYPVTQSIDMPRDYVVLGEPSSRAMFVGAVPPLEMFHHLTLLVVTRIIAEYDGANLTAEPLWVLHLLRFPTFFVLFYHHKPFLARVPPKKWACTRVFLDGTAPPRRALYP